MSFFEDASLVMIPSGIKDQKVYSVKPTDGSGDFTFSRGSDIEATRVAANGFIQKAAVNLLLQSNTFSTSWTNVDTTETGGQADKDGGTTAWKIDKTAASGRIIQTITQSGVQTFSVYAKAGTLDWVRLITVRAAGNSPSVYFDLSGSGAVGTTNETIDATIESIGSGWFRCTMSANVDTTEVRIYPAEDDNDISGTSGNIYIQDAQLNYGLVAQEYQETTTTSVVSGITNDLPRLDYSGGASCPSLLLEPSRSNLFTYDTYLNGLDFIQATATQNTDISPEGVQNAARLYDNAEDAQHRVGETFSVTIGTTYTWSVFAKKGTLRYCYLISGAGGTQRYFFDLQEGTAITSGGTIEDYGNGWYRLSATTTADETGNKVFAFNLTNDAQDNTYAGTGTDYHIVYGFQCEVGSYPTSLIPCDGTSATRLDDDMDTTFSSAITTDGSATIFFHELGVPDSDDISSTAARYRYQNDSNNYVSLTTHPSTWRVRIQGGGSSDFETLSFAYPKTDPIKIAVVVTSTTYSIYANGDVIVENQSLSATADFSSINDFLTFMEEDTGVRRAVQHLVFPTALTSSEAIALTA